MPTEPSGFDHLWTEDRPLSTCRLTGRVGLRVPGEVPLRGPLVVDIGPGSTPRVVHVELDFRLDAQGKRYQVTRQVLDQISPEELDEEYPAIAAQGVVATFDIDPGMNVAIHWGELRSFALGGIGDIVVVKDEGKDREADIADPALTDGERVGLLWLQAALTNGDPNVLIAAHFGGTREAAAQRLVRARRAGLVPPTQRAQRRPRP